MNLGRGSSRDIRVRLNALDWDTVSSDLWESGFSVLPQLLSPEECGAVRVLYGEEALFRSQVDMARHRFGRGEYKYFSYPLPPLIESLRTNLYARLAPIARSWSSAIHGPVDYPAEHADFLALCREVGQARPTPLLLRYGQGDFNCLHQDLYGELSFPFQAVFLLSEPKVEFTGGEFVLAQHVPRSQVAVRVLPVGRGDAVVFTTRYRPVKSSRGGFSRASVRHGVSLITSGQRTTMGIPFHDSK